MKILLLKQSFEDARRNVTGVTISPHLTRIAALPLVVKDQPGQARPDRAAQYDPPSDDLAGECHPTFSARAISLAAKISSAELSAIGITIDQYRSGIPLCGHL